MGQTKRKRRTKHRGNAVGMVEARGRTSKPPAGAPSKNGRATAANSRAARLAAPKPPTVRGAALKALFGVGLLFLFFTFAAGDDQTMAQTVTFCVLAFVMYTPVMYLTDKFIYNRKLKQQAAR